MIKFKNNPKDLWDFEFWIGKNKLSLEIHNHESEFIDFNSQEEFVNWLNTLNDFSFDNDKEKQEFILYCKVFGTKAFKNNLSKVNFYYKNKPYKEINVYIDKSDGDVILKFGDISLKLKYIKFENFLNKLKEAILSKKLLTVENFKFNNLRDLEDFYCTIVVEFKKKQVI